MYFWKYNKKAESFELSAFLCNFADEKDKGVYEAGDDTGRRAWDETETAD